MDCELSYIAPEQLRKIIYLREHTGLSTETLDDDFALSILEAFKNSEKKAADAWKAASLKANQAADAVFNKKLGHVPSPFPQHCLQYFDTVEEAMNAWNETERESEKAFSKILDEEFFNHLDRNPHTIFHPQVIN